MTHDVDSGDQAELDQLRASNLDRLTKLQARGVVVPNLGDHYVVAMLETLLGERLIEAQLIHEHDLAAALDSIEKQATHALLMQGLRGSN